MNDILKFIGLEKIEVENETPNNKTLEKEDTLPYTAIWIVLGFVITIVLMYFLSNYSLLIMAGAALVIMLASSSIILFITSSNEGRIIALVLIITFLISFGIMAVVKGNTKKVVIYQGKYQASERDTIRSL